MLFNSYEYIFVFLPLVVCLYFLLNRLSFTVAKLFLTAASLFFYGWWNPVYLPLLLALIVFNFGVGQMMLRSQSEAAKNLLLAFGVTVGLSVLGYFKYANFFVQNINAAAGSSYPLPNIILPLAISFFTFQKIAYLVDVRRGKIQDHSFVNYMLFVSFFPQLIAGPIVHYGEVMPQFLAPENRRPDAERIARGLTLFFIGLFKKTVIADQLALYATYGFDHPDLLDSLHAWSTSLAYTFQIYFDFSGYTDMALGAALLLNIALPINFNSPYQSLNIQEFWQRWHITLSNFLRDYLYFPLGGSRAGTLRTYLNLVIVFFLCGLWHGASWMFVLWGMLHGAAMIIHRIWRHLGFRMQAWLGWLLTFGFVNAAWVFFRATSVDTALVILHKMVVPSHLPMLKVEGLEYPKLAGWLIFSALIALALKNSVENARNFKPNLFSLAVMYALAIAAIANLSSYSEFLYFNF